MHHLTPELLAEHFATTQRDIDACRAGDAAAQNKLAIALCAEIHTEVLRGRGEFIADLWQVMVDNYREQIARQLAAQDN